MVHDAAMYIDGKWCLAEREVPVQNPANRQVIGNIQYGGREEAWRAAEAAAGAFHGWSRLPARERADVLLEIARQLNGAAEELGLLLAQETGKRLPEAVAEVHFAAEYFRWFGEEARQPCGEVLTNEHPRRRHLVVRRPVGVAACLTPWNFPVSIQARKLAPALAAGCTTVSRTSEKAPLAVVEMFKILDRVGLPAGVVNLIHGDASSQTEALLDHPALRVVSFTGSTAVGRQIMARASRRIVRVALELGGDAPFIVFPDADVEQAVEGALLAKFRNNGQSCIAANRFYVHSAVYDDFVSRFAAAVDAMSIGDPTRHPTPDLGPLIDQERVEAVNALVDEARAAGARQLTAHRDLDDVGYFLAPVLMDRVDNGARLARSEVFGPAAAIFSFDDEASVVQRANDTDMGLAAYFFTRDLGRAWRLSEELQAGIVGCNDALPSAVFAPMGGVRESGVGREGARMGLDEFCDVHYATWRL